MDASMNKIEHPSLTPSEVSSEHLVSSCVLARDYLLPEQHADERDRLRRSPSTPSRPYSSRPEIVTVIRSQTRPDFACRPPSEIIRKQFRLKRSIGPMIPRNASKEQVIYQLEFTAIQCGVTVGKPVDRRARNDARFGGCFTHDRSRDKRDAVCRKTD
jgi:hypothetical protein